VRFLLDFIIDGYSRHLRTGGKRRSETFGAAQSLKKISFFSISPPPQLSLVESEKLVLFGVIKSFTPSFE